MQVSVDLPPQPPGKADLYANTTNPMAVMPVRPDAADSSVRLTSSVSLASRLPHDLSKLSASSLITLQLAERVPLRTFYDGLFRFPCHYGMQLYIKAAELYDRLRTGCEPGSKFNLVVGDLIFDGNEEKRLAYELAYATLKYEDVLFQTLADASFSARHPEYQGRLSLAAVILYDYQERRFQRRPHLASDLETPHELRRLEQALLLMRTRLSACLARLRILHDAPSMVTLLPADLQPREANKQRPVYGWINNNKCSTEEALDSLWSTLKSLQPELVEEQRFQYDEDFADLLCFEAGWKETILKTTTCRNRWLVLQEKACCLPAYAAVQELRRLWEREPELRGSLLQVGAGSGRTLAHVVGRLPPRVRTALDGVTALAGDRKEVLDKQLDELGVRDARVLSGSLEQPNSLSVKDLAALRDVVAAIVTPETTQTALLDPVGWVVEESGDISLLRELSLDRSRSQLQQRVSALVTTQNETLLRTLRLPRVRVVVYATHSANRAENEEVVFGVVDEVNEEQRRRLQAERDRQNSRKLDLEAPPDKLYELRQLLPPGPEEQADTQPLAMPFLVLPQTQTSSGVFIAVIVKNVEYIRRENRSVIDTALDMGILEGLGPQLAVAEKAEAARPGRRRHRRAKPASFRSERAIHAGKTAGEASQSPAAATSMPVAVVSPRKTNLLRQNVARQFSPRQMTPRQVMQIHVQTPHLGDCTCSHCRQAQRRRRTSSQPVAARAESTPGGRPRRSDSRHRQQKAADSEQEGSVSSLPADDSRIDRDRIHRESSLGSPLPPPSKMPPIHGREDSMESGECESPYSDMTAASPPSPGHSESIAVERSRCGQRETLEELSRVSAEASREALRAIQQQMAGDQTHQQQPPLPQYNEMTVADMRELSRLRTGLLMQHQLPYWWYLQGGGQPALDPALRPYVRQLLAPTRRPAARWGLSSPQYRAPPAQTSSRYRHGASVVSRDGSQPPRQLRSQAERAPTHATQRGGRLRLPLLPRRRRDLSLGAPLPMHKVNIGDNLPSTPYVPATF